MPEIPEFRNNNRIANLPGPVLDRESRQVMGPRALINAVTQATQGSDVSQHLQTLGPEHFGASSAKALGAIGQGIADVGNVFAQINQRKMEAQNEFDRAEAESFLANQYADYEKWKVEQAPGKPEVWEEEWSKRKQQAIGKMNERGYSPMVRDQLNAYSQRWDGQTSIRAATDATRAVFARTRESMEARRAMYLQEGNVAGAEQVTAKMVEQGHETAERGALTNLLGREQVYAKERNDLVTTDPANVQRWAANPDAEDAPQSMKALRDSPAQRIELSLAAQAEQSQQKAKVNNSISDAIQTGEVTNGRSLQLFVQRVDPEGKILSKSEIRYHVDSLQGFPVDMEMFHRVEGDINKLDPSSKESLLAEAQIGNLITLMRSRPGAAAYAETLKERLDLKKKTFTDGLKSQFDAIESSVDVMKNEGAFGVYQIPANKITWNETAQGFFRQPEAWEVEKLGASAGPVRVQISQEAARKLTAGKDKDGGYKAGELIIDEAARQQAEKTALDMKMKFQRNRANGAYGNDPSLARKELQMMTEASTREMMRQRLNDERRQTDAAPRDPTFGGLRPSMPWQWGHNGKPQAPAVQKEGALPDMQQGGDVTQQPNPLLPDPIQTAEEILKKHNL